MLLRMHVPDQPRYQILRQLHRLAPAALPVEVHFGLEHCFSVTVHLQSFQHFFRDLLRFSISPLLLDGYNHRFFLITSMQLLAIGKMG